MKGRTLVLMLLACCGCQPAPTHSSPATGETPRPAGEVRPVTAAGLHNAFRVSDRVYSGSSPDGDEGFASLEKLGVKTVISVDGAAPEVASAERHGLRYVHLPVGYDGIPAERAAELAKAVRDLPGPVYIHCHHGLHRGPAACAAVQLALDPTWTPEQAEKWLAAAGTDPKYTGLHGLPRAFHKPTTAELDAASSAFPPTAPVTDLVKRMVEVDARWDHLKLAKAAGWTPPKDHPDLDPPHEAVQLVEHYREAQRLESVKRRGLEFGKLLSEGESAAVELEQALRQKPVNSEQVGQAFARSSAACTACHTKFRNPPR